MRTVEIPLLHSRAHWESAASQRAQLPFAILKPTMATQEKPHKLTSVIGQEECSVEGG